MSIYAFCVGIDNYAGDVPNLSGCENDIRRFSSLIKKKYRVSSDHIKICLSKQATKTAVVDGVKNHLGQAEAGDIALFYYSGHGSQERAPVEMWEIEPDHLNETIVCYDSRIGAGDLADKELRYLIAKLAEDGADVVIIFDCCHSGSGTRSVGESTQVGVRLTKSAATGRTLDSYIFSDDPEREAWFEGKLPFPAGKHVLLSACRDSELAKETSFGAMKHGAFTNYLCESLEGLNFPISYRNLVARASEKVRSRFSYQHPRIDSVAEFDTDTYFLGSDIQSARLLVYFDNGWFIAAGATQGRNKGDLIAVYPQGKGAAALANARVTEVHPDKSIIEFVDGENQLDRGGQQYEAKISLQKLPRIAIQFEGDESAVNTARQALAVLSEHRHPSLFLKEAPESSVYTLRAENNRYVITRSEEQRHLFRPDDNYDLSSATKALQKLEHMARWEQKLLIDNPGSQIPSDAVHLIITTGGRQFRDEDVELQYEQLDQSPEFKLELAISREWEHKTLYCALLYFDSVDGYISTELLPAGIEQLGMHDAGDSETSRAPRRRALAYEGQPIPAAVADSLYQQGVTQTQDFIKLIVSETEFDPSLLSQAGLDNYDPEKEARSVMRGGGDDFLNEQFSQAHSRALGSRAKPKVSDWMSKTVTITTLRPLPGVKVSQTEQRVLASGVTIEPHSALQATITLQGQAGVMRSLSEAGLGRMATPLALQDEEMTPPYTFSKSRGVDAGLGVLTVLSMRDQGSVTHKNPLLLSVEGKLEANTQILPYSFDGEFYLPLGYAEANDGDSTTIKIVALPEVEATDSQIQERGLGSSLKIFFQKVYYNKLLIDKGVDRLAIPAFDNSVPTNISHYVDDLESLTNKIAAANRIMLLVHGIIGQTNVMTGALSAVLKDGSKILDQYDLALTFDYENLNTPIQEIAISLKTKLEAVGLGEGHSKQLDIVAHSMGGLVSRWLIECEQGNKLIHKLVMLGTPSGGAPWSGVKDKGVDVLQGWAFTNLALVLNNLTVAPVGGLAVAVIMKFLNSIDNTLDQMGSDSTFVRKLHQSKDPAIPYFLIAGDTQSLRKDNSQIKYSVANLFKRLMKRGKFAAYDLLTRTLFKEPNDVAVAISSMQYVPEGRSKPLVVKPVQSDHLSYFITDESVEALAGVLKK